MELTPHQSLAAKAVEHWYRFDKREQPWFYVAGFAGTGKTSLATYFASLIDGEVCFAAFTGKAAHVMRSKGCWEARTIHSLIYIADEKDDGTVEFHLNQNSPAASAKLIIVDEVSMVDDELAADLLSFGTPVLVLGDPAQLPPVGGEGFFTRREPDVMLTEIHRQAAGNPIIRMATRVREGHSLELGDYGDSRVVSKMSTTDALGADQVLVGRNVTRTSLNRKIRRLNGLTDELPVMGDRLICLKNDSTLKIFNGGMFTVLEVLKRTANSHFVHMKLEREDEAGQIPALVSVHKSFFTDMSKPDWRVLKGSQEFDFAYAVTAHKAQGSQWDDVLVVDEGWAFREDAVRWRYTAITRAAQKLTVVKS